MSTLRTHVLDLVRLETLARETGHSWKGAHADCLAWLAKFGAAIMFEAAALASEDHKDQVESAIDEAYNTGVRNCLETLRETAAHLVAGR